MTIDGDGAPAPEGVPPPEGIPPPGELGLPGDTGPTRSVARNMGALLSSQIVTWLLATILVWFVPRYLGAESFGEFRLASSIWLIAGIIAQFGTSTLTTIEVARHRTSARSFVRHVIRVRLVLLAIVAPVVIGIFVVGPYSRSTLEVGVIVGVGAIVTMFLTAFESGLHGLQEMGRSASAHVVTKFAATVLTIVVLLAGGRLIPMAIVYVAGSALTMTLLFVAFRKCTTNLTAPSPLAGRTLALAAAPFLVVEATRVIYQQLDTVVISLVADSEAIGWYAAADTLFGSLLFVPVIAATALFPAMADLHDKAPSEVKPLLQRSFTAMLIAAVPIGVGTIVVAPSVVRLLFGPGFEETGPVLEVFGFVVIVSSQTILLGRFALATGRVRFWSSMMVAVTVLSIPLDLVLVPWTHDRFDNGAIGGALAYVVTEALLIVAGVWKLAPWLVNRTAMWRIARCIFAGVLMALAGWPFRDMFFLVPGAISLIVYVAAILLTKTLREDERAMLGRLRTKVIRR